MGSGVWVAGKYLMVGRAGTEMVPEPAAGTAALHGAGSKARMEGGGLRMAKQGLQGGRFRPYRPGIIFRDGSRGFTPGFNLTGLQP